MSAETLIGVVTVIAGGIALYFSRTQANTEREAAVHASFLAISEAFLAYPLLRPLFYEDEQRTPEEADLSDEDRLRANALAELTLDTFDLAVTSRPTRKLYEDYMRCAFQRSAFLADWARRNATVYDHRLIELAVRERSD